MEKWKKIGQEKVYDGYRKIVSKKFILPNGSEKSFEIIDGEDSVGVIAITKSNEILLVRQFRPGTEEIYDEIPAGIIDENEEPIDAAKREFLEETGYTGDFEFVTSVVDSAYKTTIRYCFVVKNCYKIQEPKLEESEFIELVIKPLQEFKGQLRSGKLTDVEIAYLGLDYLNLI